MTKNDPFTLGMAKMLIARLTKSQMGREPGSATKSHFFKETILQMFVFSDRLRFGFSGEANGPIEFDFWLFLG